MKTLLFIYKCGSLKMILNESDNLFIPFKFRGSGEIERVKDDLFDIFDYLIAHVTTQVDIRGSFIQRHKVFSLQ